MNIEKFSDTKPVNVLDSASLAGTDLTGDSIDTQFYRSLTVAIKIDGMTEDGSLDSVGFTESDDNSTFTAVDDDEVLYYPDDLPYSADDVIHVGCISKKRYVKMVLGNTADSTGTVSVLGVLQDSLTKPMVKTSSVLSDDDIVSPGETADAVVTAPKR